MLRSADVGSIVAARRAGSHAAIVAVTASSSAAIVSIVASVGVTPNNRFSSTRTNTSVAGLPGSARSVASVARSTGSGIPGRAARETPDAFWQRWRRERFLDVTAKEEP